MAIWMMAWAGLKRKKGVELSMCLLIALAAAMLDMGASLLTGIGTFYDQANQDLNGAHYMIRFSANEYKEEYLDFFLNDSRTAAAEAEEIVLMDNATLQSNGALSATMLDLDRPRAITGFTIETCADVPEDQAIYLPEYFKQLGYLPGDPFSLDYQKQRYTFFVAGYSQSTWLHASASSLADFYLPEASYERIYSMVGGGYLLSVQLHDPDDVAALRQDFREKTDVKMESATMNSKIMDFSLEEMRTGSTMVVSILSATFLAFAILIVLVSMIVIRFRISNHIETQLPGIGTLGALGYTGKEICRSIALEFLVMGIVGTVSGVFLSYVLASAMGAFISNAIGLQWKTSLHLFSDIATSSAVLAAVFFVSQLSARKAARILPVSALRGGIRSHNFARNHIPLDKTSLKLSAALGLKHCFFQLKTYLMVGVVFAGTIMALFSSLILFWNMGLNNDLLIEMSGYEISDVLVYAAPHTDYEKLTSDIENMEDVKKTTFFETASVTIGHELVTCYLSDDYRSLETVKAYEGSMPVYDNEIVITGVLADMLHKTVGDTVNIQINGVSADYIICGLGQTMSNFGRQCYLTLEGVLRLNPAYQKQTIQVYLNPDADIDVFIQEMEQRFKVLSPSADHTETGNLSDTGNDSRKARLEAAKKRAEERLARLLTMYDVDNAQFALMADGEIILSGDTFSYQIDHIENNRLLFASNLTVLSTASTLLTSVILIGTLLIIMLVFYMVIKSMLVRRSREFGIYKANGYTNRQLMEQIAVSFMPSVILGTVFGFLLACMFINPLCSSLFNGIGVSRLSLRLHPELLVVAGIALILFSFFICMAMACKIRKISVYALLTE